MPRPARIVDLRSDTVTHPTPEMRRAMAEAEVGDDVMGEDPTVNELEAVSAETLGKEAALFFPSGTMANQAAVFTHTRRQGELVLEKDAHIAVYECGGPALWSGVSVRTIAGNRGVFTPEDLARVYRPLDLHGGATTLVAIENTHNRASGAVWTPAQTRALARAAHERGVPVHVDGARLFNSAVAQKIPPAALAADADSVMFSLSKGLSAPVGSILSGSREFVDRARWARKALGGGMRQAGVIAAAGLVALRTMVDRLREDHANARRLAQGLAELPGLALDLPAIQTNIVIANVQATGRAAPRFVEDLAKQGIKCFHEDEAHVRFVTHRHIGPADVDYVLERVAKLAAPQPGTARRAR